MKSNWTKLASLAQKAWTGNRSSVYVCVCVCVCLLL